MTHKYKYLKLSILSSLKTLDDSFELLYAENFFSIHSASFDAFIPVELSNDLGALLAGFLGLLYGDQAVAPNVTMAVTSLPSGVFSSNCSPSLNFNSMDLRVVEVLMVHTPPSSQISITGVDALAALRSKKLTSSA